MEKEHIRATGLRDSPAHPQPPVTTLITDRIAPLKEKPPELVASYAEEFKGLFLENGEVMTTPSLCFEHDGQGATVARVSFKVRFPFNVDDQALVQFAEKYPPFPHGTLVDKITAVKSDKGTGSEVSLHCVFPFPPVASFMDQVVPEMSQGEECYIVGITDEDSRANDGHKLSPSFVERYGLEHVVIGLRLAEARINEMMKDYGHWERLNKWPRSKEDFSQDGKAFPAPGFAEAVVHKIGVMITDFPRKSRLATGRHLIGNYYRALYPSYRSHWDQELRIARDQLFGLYEQVLVSIKTLAPNGPSGNLLDLQNTIVNNARRINATLGVKPNPNDMTLLGSLLVDQEVQTKVRLGALAAKHDSKSGE